MSTDEALTKLVRPEREYTKQKPGYPKPVDYAYENDITRQIWQYIRNNKELGIDSGWDTASGLVIMNADTDDHTKYARINYNHDTDSIEVTTLADRTTKAFPFEDATIEEILLTVIDSIENKTTKKESYYSQGNHDGRWFRPAKAQESFPSQAAYLSYKKGYNDGSLGIYEATNDLFVMDAWETARLMGSVYFDEDPEDTEKRLNNSKKESKMKNYECSMQKKIESFKKSESSKTAVRSNKKNEGPGAGYTVTIKEMTIAEKPQITYDEAKDVFKVVAPVEYEADAEGYDWSSAYIINELMGMDEGTFPHNPFKGELELEIPNDESVWNEVDSSAFDDVENPTIDEKLDVLYSAFYKDKEFDDFSESYGGGWSHSKYTDVAQIVAMPDGYGDFVIDFATSNDFNGTLTIDEYFLQDIEIAHDYDSNRYELVEAIKKYISDKGLEPSWDEDSIYDYVAPYVTDVVTDDYVKETLQEMIDSGLEFYNKDRDTVEIDLS